MIKKIEKDIRIAEEKYTEFLSSCSTIAKEAQKHIDWSDEVHCDYIPGDGICIGIDVYLYPVVRFFMLCEKSDNGMVDEWTYKHNCI